MSEAKVNETFIDSTSHSSFPNDIHSILVIFLENATFSNSISRAYFVECAEKEKKKMECTFLSSESSTLLLLFIFLSNDNKTIIGLSKENGQLVWRYPIENVMVNNRRQDIKRKSDLIALHRKRKKYQHFSRFDLLSSLSLILLFKSIRI
ncbi:hypothetical protein TNCT_180981 [Trichonephila clavata]|uniref:Uncharacterized protein n=1 Tax=Trichonephila clavata TaxID=2740835 RepID=A0A8X6KLW3_TRICU|nr:hypothetical protein TNCT_180981 [Trichonephila clavata]